MAISSSMSMSWIGNTLGQATSIREDALKTTLTSVGDNPSTSQMLKMQAEIQEWTMFMQIQTTLVKTVSDAYKDAIHKAA